MKAIQLTNQIYTGAQGRKSLVDLEIPENFNQQLIIFIHGYMGYKDWGCWNLVQRYYTDIGFAFCKYNVSHNGGTIDEPIDFPDLDAFSKNTYFNELTDLKCILDWLKPYFKEKPVINLIGHSRGGGIALLGALDERVDKVVSWSGISNIESRMPEGKELRKWESQGVRFGVNSRTNQEMPHLFIQYTDFVAHQEELDIEMACKTANKPTFLIHGDRDKSVSIDEGRELAEWLGIRLFEIEDADHTYGSKQPWVKPKMAKDLEKVCLFTASFLAI